MESQRLDWSHLIQLCACLGNLGLKSILFHCDLCLRLFFSIFKNFFFLNFNSIPKADHVLDCNTLCKRDIFIGFIIWFQISKCLVCNIWTKLVLWKCCQCLIPSLQSAWDGNSILLNSHHMFHIYTSYHGTYVIFSILKKSNTALMQALMLYWINIIQSLYYLFKESLNLFMSFSLF